MPVSSRYDTGACPVAASIAARSPGSSLVCVWMSTSFIFASAATASRSSRVHESAKRGAYAYRMRPFAARCHRLCSAALASSEAKKQIGDLCKECGQATFIYEEGCKKCLSCGFNEC